MTGESRGSEAPHPPTCDSHDECHGQPSGREIRDPARGGAGRNRCRLSRAPNRSRSKRRPEGARRPARLRSRFIERFLRESRVAGPESPEHRHRARVLRARAALRTSQWSTSIVAHSAACCRASSLPQVAGVLEGVSGGSRTCSFARHRPSRPEARERHGDVERRRQDRGLRRCESAPGRGESV